MTIPDYDALLASQGGTCAICGGANANGQRLAVDHNHATGKVRGLLCHNCNSGIGHLMDRPDWLRKAAEYVESRAD